MRVRNAPRSSAVGLTVAAAAALAVWAMPLRASTTPPSAGEDLTIGAAAPALEARIPEFSLTLTCGGQVDPHRLAVDEAKALVDFAGFIERNQDEVVYVGVRIDQTCAACGCPRAAPDNKGAVSEAEYRAGRLSIDTSTAMVRRQGFPGIGWGGAKMFLEGILLDARIPAAGAVDHQIFLPRWEHLTAAQYRAGEYGTFARFDGLFVARFHGRTGVNMLYLDVLDTSDRQLEQVRVIRQRRDAPAQADESQAGEH